MASGLARLLQKTSPDLPLKAVLTRRKPEHLPAQLSPLAIPVERIEAFLQQVDLVVECSGDIRHATEVIAQALTTGKPVITMHTEWHVTVGSAFDGQGLLSEAEGDQPGSLAALAEEMRMMGFEAWAYGNIKQYLNLTPSRADMEYWSNKQGLSLRQTIAFTDGTKIQFEQALVANGLGAGLIKPGLWGPSATDLQHGGCLLAEAAWRQGEPISDYLLAPSLPPGVFITARHAETEQAALAYLKLGPGPWYTLYRPYHLCQYEMLKTLRRLLSRQGPLLNNGSRPRVGVRAIAKRDLRPGETIANAIGSFELRGEAFCLAEHPTYLPMGLIQDATVLQPVAAGQALDWKDVELPDCLALQVYRRFQQSLQNAAP